MNFGGELFVALGAIGNSKEVQAFGNAVNKAGKAIDDFDKKQNKTQQSSVGVNTALKGTIGAVLGVVGAMATAFYAIDRLTQSLAQQNQQWLLLANQSDVAYSSLQKWGTIGKIAGIQNVEQQIQSLEQKIFNLKLTGEGARGFQIAGIMPTNPEDVLEQLRGKVSGLSNASATYLLQQMGLDPKMLTLLRMGREEWEQYVAIQRKYTLNEDQRKELEKYNRQLQVARIQMQYLKDRAILAILPAFTRLTKFLASATEGIARMVKWIVKSQTPLAGLIRIIIATTVAVKGLRLALLLLSSHPIIAGITALIGAIMLLADDVNHYLNGGGSVIGVIAKGLEDLDVKGFIDFEAPAWLKMLVYAIDNCYKLITIKDTLGQSENIKKNRGVRNVRSAEDVLSNIDYTKPLSERQQEAIKKLEKINKLQHSWNTQGDIESGAVPNYILRSISSPQTRQDIRNSNVNKTSNVTMNVDISTNQPVQDMQKQLIYAQMLGVQNG